MRRDGFQISVIYSPKLLFEIYPFAFVEREREREVLQQNRGDDRKEREREGISDISGGCGRQERLIIGV